MRPRPVCRLFPVRWLLASLLLAGALATAKPIQWDLITFEQHSATHNLLHPDSKAEYLFIKTTVRDWAKGFIVTDTRRIKLYSAYPDLVQELLSLYEQPGEEVQELVARITKPDGRVIETSPSDVVRTLARKDREGTVWKVSLPLSNIEPGDIVDLRFTVRYPDWIVRLFAQQAFPVRRYSMVVTSRLDLKIGHFQLCEPVVHTLPTYPGQACREYAFVELPPFAKEPFSGPEGDTRGMILLTLLKVGDVPRITAPWNIISRYMAEEHTTRTKPNKAIRRQAKLLTETLATPAEKLAALHTFCRTKIANSLFFEVRMRLRSEVSDSSNRKASAVLDTMAGNAREINTLFAALASACGFEQYLALAGSHTTSQKLNHPNGWAFADHPLVAVKLEGKWTYHDPGSPMLPYGMLPSNVEQCQVARLEDIIPVFDLLPCSPATGSVITRKAILKLDDDGELSGEVTLTYTGHYAEALRFTHWAQSAAESAELVSTEVTSRLHGAEVDDVKLSAIYDRNTPPTLTYRIRIPAYAETLGNKLTLTPCFFEKGKPVSLPQPTRVQSLHLPHAGQLNDHVEITLPEGQELIAPTAPAMVLDKFGVKRASYEVKYQKPSRTVIYERQEVLGLSRRLVWPPKTYPEIRDSFNAVHRSDGHLLLVGPAAAD